MKVVEPNRNKNMTQKRNTSYAKISTVFIVVSLVGMTGFYTLSRNQNMKQLKLEDEAAFTTVVNQETPIEREATQIIGDEKYQALWYSLSIPQTRIPDVAPDINQDTGFTRLVSSIAEAQGYNLQKVYYGDDIDFFRGIPLDRSLVQPLQELINYASSSGLTLSISSAYRDLEEQEEIFMSRYNSQIADGYSVEQAIKNVLEGAAPPGYSKHHSAFTVDMTCNGLGAKNFIGTSCDTWLSADDYLIARKYGFIPSYPGNVDVQGPIPEPWEYNYIGINTLTEVGLLAQE